MSCSDVGLEEILLAVNIGQAVNPEEKSCYKVEKIRVCISSAGGGCEVAVTARTRCWWVKLMNVVSNCMERDFF